MESGWRKQFETIRAEFGSQNVMNKCRKLKKCNCDIIIFYQLQRTRKAILLELQAANQMRIFQESLKQIGGAIRRSSFTIVPDHGDQWKVVAFLNFLAQNKRL
jgi:hypothetical protein